MNWTEKLQAVGSYCSLVVAQKPDASLLGALRAEWRKSGTTWETQGSRLQGAFLLIWNHSLSPDIPQSQLSIPEGPSFFCTLKFPLPLFLMLFHFPTSGSSKPYTSFRPAQSPPPPEGHHGVPQPALPRSSWPLQNSQSVLIIWGV